MRVGGNPLHHRGSRKRDAGAAALTSSHPLRGMPATRAQVREAQLVKSTVIKEIHATFSPAPGVDQLRPSQATASERVFLAGDWTATRWPATMEGAVRSGYLAAEALAAAANLRPTRLLVSDLPTHGLMRLFG